MTQEGHAHIRFEADDIEVDVKPGTKLAQAIDAVGADIPFGCKRGTCGTCRVHVLAGAENLSPMASDEKDFLEALEAGPTERLACQVRVNGDCTVEAAIP